MLVFSECFKLFLALFDMWAENRISSRELDFQQFLKKHQNMFSWWFLSVSRYLSIVRNLSREPHFWAENRIFKNLSKSLKTCFVGVFWVFQGIFIAFFDIWAENRIFEPRTRGCFTIVSQALQNNLAKIYNAKNHIQAENFKLKIVRVPKA